MDAAQDGVSPMLGAGCGDGDLGAISPELALIDPELAERARQYLPRPGEQRKPRPTVAAPEALLPAAASPPRRWRRTVVLASLVFAAGAASGGYLGDQHAESPGLTLGVRAGALPTHPSRPSSVVPQPALRPPKVPAKSRRVAKRERRHRRQQVQRQAARTVWATNVLGVSAQVASGGVTLVWQQPADSGRVVVVRARGGRAQGAVVFRGQATSFRDNSPRPCTAYRYTIVNYDRHGHRSTGVPTSIVTAGCT